MIEEDRIVSSGTQGDEAAFDRAVRPKKLADYVGQSAVKTQMEIFILEDMNELDAARVVLGGLLESGRIGDADEARFLRHKLEELERRTKR